MIKAHQIKLNPTKAQKTLLQKSFGCARHSFNWALSKWKELYEAGEKPSAYSLIKHQNSIKRTEMPFYMEVNKCAVQYAIHNVEAAYKKMWKEKAGHPRFKKKGVKDSYVAVENNRQFKQTDNRIWLPRIGWVKCFENLRFEGKVNNVVIKRIADMYFAVINIDTINDTSISVCENQAAVGIDMGIKSMMVLSDGTVFENPKALKNNLKKMKRLQRGLSRKVLGSNNRKRQQVKVARLHYRISCIRKNAIHQATSYIVKNYRKIVIESLRPTNMVKNRNIAQSVQDVSFGEIARQLSYKAQWNGNELVKADTFFASSKLCSCCGCKKDVLKLSDRIYKCDNCGLVIDRDLNAAKNLASYSPTPKFEESKACGAHPSAALVSGRMAKKQEMILSKSIAQNFCVSS